MFDFIKNKVFIIAEAGVNHNGSLEIAKKLVDAAVEAGADAVKFQTFKVERVVTRSAQKAEYQKKTTESDESQFEMLKKLELSYEAHSELYQYCDKKGILFLSAPFDTESVDLLEKLGVKAFKIGSGEITNMPLIKYIANKGRPVILSTGMANLGEVEEAVSWIQKEGNNQIILMHCTTNYPTNFEDVNLKAMITMREAFKLQVGYSDHTLGIEVPIAAVAMGACVIEKHFTLDKEMEGPDHKASLSLFELQEMVKRIRNVELSMGNGIKKMMESEKENLYAARKFVAAKRNIKKGKKIEYDDLDIKRSQVGILPKYLDQIVGMIVKKDITEDEAIEWKDIGY